MPPTRPPLGCTFLDGNELLDAQGLYRLVQRCR